MLYPKTDTELLEVRRLPDERLLQLTWSDGSTARPSYDLLQGYCPCALCRGHDGGEITYQPPKRPIRSVGIEPVGNYAISVVFERGCRAGIFPFDFLREVCRRQGLLSPPAPVPTAAGSSDPPPAS